MPFNAYTVPANSTQTARIDMDENDTLAVASTGALNVSANAQAVRFGAATAGAVISNDGLIADTAAGGRAVRFETGVGPTLTATINNGPNAVTAEIRAVEDAVQIQTRAFTGGLLTVNNAGLIQSSIGQAIDFGGATGPLAVAITNGASGRIIGDVSEAIRVGTTGAVIVNAGTIAGGNNAGYTQSVDGIQFEDNTSGTVTNNDGGVVSGDRHGVDAGVGSTISVVNNAGGTITGRNGSGVGSDGSGSVTNYGRITGAVTNNVATDANSPGRPGVPDGIPDGDGDGVDMDGTITLQNFGRIEGLGASGHGSDGLPNTSDGVAAGGGFIVNNAGGVIISTDRGILIDNGSQGNSFAVTNISNAGTIEGSNGVGIKLISTFADTITNTGTITGGNGQAIQFGAGNNTLILGNTSVISGSTNGEGGQDTLDYSIWDAGGVTVNLASGSASGTGGVGNFEIIRGSNGDDRLFGGNGDNTLYGGVGNDLLDGGLVGTNHLNGGTGDDTYTAHSQYDFITELNDEGFDSIFVLNSDYSLTISAGGANIEALRIISNGHVGTGSSQNDFIEAQDDNIRLFGGGGNDTLVAHGRNDILYGSVGNDIYVTNARDVSIREAADEGADTLYADGIDFSLADAPQVENLVLRGNNHVGAGTNSNDLLLSAGSNNQLFGGGGDDVFSFTPSRGATQVLDFDARPGEHDVAAFTTAQFANFAAVQAHLAQVGADAVITAADGGGDTYILKNVVAANLNASDFLFV